MFFIRVFLSVMSSLAASLFLIPKFCNLANKLDFFDEPDGKLKIQKNKVPYFGGLSIYCAFIFSLLLNFPLISNICLYLIAATILLLVGLLDDFLCLSPAKKLLGQFIATLCFVKAGFFFKWSLFPPVVNIVISCFWFLTIINAINLVDVMDGLSSTLALSSIASFCLFFYLNFSPIPIILFSSLFGAILGFLYYNKPPAKIYMGDAGTLFIGGLLASAPFFVDWSRYGSIGIVIPVLLLSIPLLELGALIIIRTYKGIPFYNGSPDHFSIYLRKKHWSIATILGFCVCINIIVLLLSLLFALEVIKIPTLLVLCATSLIFWIKIIF